MNTDTLEGKWDQLKGKIQEQWGKLTDNDLTVIKGERNKLVGKIKEKYGYTSEKAEKEINRFLSDCGCSSPRAGDSEHKSM